MKFLKGMLLVGVILILVYLVLCALGPASFDTERSTIIKATPGKIYAELADFRKWEAWSPWAMRDTAMEVTFSENPAFGLGAWQEWKSESQGSGKQTIIEARPNEFLRTRLEFADWPEPSFSNWVLEKQPDLTTKVTWSMDSSSVPFIVRGLMLVMNAKKSIESDYELGLKNLKTYIESLPDFAPLAEYNEDQWYVGKLVKDVAIADLDGGNIHKKAYGEIAKFFAENELAIVGEPMAISRRFSDGAMDIEFAMPVIDSIGVTENLTIGKIPSGKFLYTIHYGPYNTVTKSWNLMKDYIETRKEKVRWYPFEVYLNDPTTVEESEIATKIVFPVAEMP